MSIIRTSSHPLFVPLFVVGCLARSPLPADAEPVPRNDWYWDSVVNLHLDNHSGLVGRGYTVAQLTAMVKDIPVSLIQVSALGANGWATIPTEAAPHADLGDWDTLATWRQVARRLNRRFGVYLNTRGLQLHRQHPDWVQRNARGRGRGRGTGLDLCLRPSPAGTGALETMFLPLLREIMTRYHPDAVWVDGDHARTWTCYCPNCRAAWQAKTGEPTPPTGPGQPRWAEWLRFESDRFDRYRREMADVVHDLGPGCLYTSNHSWRFKSKDPRSAPDFVDTLSGDLSHGDALRLTRLSAMQLSPEDRLPHDIMHNIWSVAAAKPERVSQRRLCQLGGLTFASGSVWFLWVPGSSIVQPDRQERARFCARFARAREDALGRSLSRNQTAVLLSESCWEQERRQGRAGFYDPTTPEHVALALQDAGFAVDLVNEALLRAHLRQYRTVVIANQRAVAATTFASVRTLVERGGLLLVTGDGLRADRDREDPAVARLLGLTRTEQSAGLERVEQGALKQVVARPWQCTVESARVSLRTVEGTPFLTTHSTGHGRVAYLSLTQLAYPDDSGAVLRAMQALGIGPAVRVEDADRRFVFAFREKPAQNNRLIVHVVDLHSQVGGRRVLPGQTNAPDDEPPLPSVRLTLPMPVRPTAVKAAPDDTHVVWQWNKGALHLTLQHVQVHTAALIDGEPAEPLPYLPPDSLAPPRPVAYRPYREDFESFPVGGEVPLQCGRSHSDDRTAILVTEATAASGRHALAFKDTPQARPGFLPYFVLAAPPLRLCTGRFSCDLRLDADAAAALEFRHIENARQFPVGPSIRFGPKGRISVAGRKAPLTSFPVGQWFHVEVVFHMDGPAAYDLTVKLRGQAPRVFHSLPFRSADFWQCGWIGISGLSKAETTFYVDNLQVTTVPR